MAVAQKNIALLLQERDPPAPTNVIAGETTAWFIREEPAGFVIAVWEYAIDGPGTMVSDEFYPIGNVIYLDGPRLRMIAFKFDAGVTKITFKLPMVSDAPTLYAEVHAQATP